MTDQEWIDAELIIARTDNVEDLKDQIVRHARILLYLVCDMARKTEQSEEGIRWLYSKWADMTVDEFRCPGKPGREQ
jgi:hypothetical protein